MKLSICIATLNRAAFIGETLESIGRQTREDVEIVVLDGGSKDGTELVVRGLKETIPRLRYIRQDTNHGVDRDFDTVVQHAAGEYCWLMSDDDLVMPGAVEAVLSALGSGAFSLVIVNSEIKTFDFSRVLDANRLRFAADRVYAPADFERLFEETAGYLTYIGAVVIKRQLWLERHRERYFGSYFVHVGVIFEAPLPGRTLVLARPCVSVRFGNTQWRPKEFEIRMIRWTELIWSLSSLSEEVRARRYRREPWRSIKSLLFYRAKGTYSMTEYTRWIAPRATTWWDAVRASSIARLPGTLANLIGLAFCSLPYRDSNIHFLDMKASRFYLPHVLRGRAPAASRPSP